MPCYRCGVRQTDPSRGQSPWKRGVRQYSQILICPGCQDAADWKAELDRCSQCSSVHLVKRLGEVECRDCGAIVPPSGEMGYRGVLEPAGSATDLRGLGDAGPEDPGLAGAGPAGAGVAGAGLAGGDLAGGDLAGGGRSPDLSEEVARALDRVLSRSLVSQSLQRASEPEGRAGSVAGSGADGWGSGTGRSGSGAGRPGSGTGRSGSGAGRSGSGTGRRRSARAAAGDHTAAHPGAERHRAPRPGLVGEDAGRLDEVGPGAFAG